MRISITFPDEIARKVCRLSDRDAFVTQAVEAALVRVPEVSKEEELDFEDEILPLQTGEEGPADMDAVTREIDGLYDQIRDLITERAGDPGLKAAIRPLQEKLRALQEREADAMELHFRAQLVFDPREGRKLLAELEEMERRLGRQ